MKRISLLALTLFTFFIGVSLTAFWIFIYQPKSDLSSQIMINSNKTSEQIIISQEEKPKFNANDIEIQYAWSLIGRDSLAGIFYVKNNSSETIYYSGYDRNNNRHCWVKQNGKVKATSSYSSEGNNEQELKPNESTDFTILVPQNENPFEAGFNFQIGNERDEKTIWVKVKKQLKSFGIGCGSNAVKPESVLAKTCIEVIQ